jgi:hypothetical protein
MPFEKGLRAYPGGQKINVTSHLKRFIVMYSNQISNRQSSEPLGCRVIKSHNQLGISRIDRITDKHRKNLILILESDRSLGTDFNALLRESNLILEAPLEPEYDKPFHTHLVGREILDDEEEVDPLIGFTEIRLNPVFYYSVQSCQVMHPGLIKVVLKYNPNKKKNNHFNS